MARRPPTLKHKYGFSKLGASGDAVAQEKLSVLEVKSMCILFFETKSMYNPEKISDIFSQFRGQKDASVICPTMFCSPNFTSSPVE